MRQLVFIHGRAQEHKDASALKAEWLDALGEGLAKSGLSLPIAESDVRFPFYGNTLYDLVQGRSASGAAEVIVRGTESDAAEEQFVRAVLENVRKKAGVTEEQLLDVTNAEVIEKGPANWEWVQGVLRAIDRYVPYGSGSAIALATRDVFQYLKNTGIRTMIDEGVAQAVDPTRETVVVAHSLGTVVAYNLLTQRGGPQGWTVPLFITLGCPLGVEEIRKTVRPLTGTHRCPPCAGGWFNAMDDRDVVALYPLTPDAFPLDPSAPAIQNKTDVRNRTQNRHGISGYLDDAEVARRIHAALTA